ncbi:MAG: hypothetical protein GEU93_16795 [Propionibacteriales bacterium]|nr:hypothetical protein [Propionibacteriales bacterium]MPZ67455.1 hypothetical protein [Pseudonocardiaceae bacterium]
MARRTALADVLGDDTDTTPPVDTDTTRKTTKKAAKTPRKRSQAPRKTDSTTTTGEEEQTPARVKAADVADAKRVSVYLHPDDYRALALAKLEDGADLNARLRAMIALWQANSRFKLQVDRLAKSAPRGGGH